MPCYKCGMCCRQLSWEDRINISLHTRTLMFKKICKFLGSNNLCKIYDKRAKVCKAWVCGTSRTDSSDFKISQ